MRIASHGINGYNASLIGRFGVGDVGKYGFALGDTLDLSNTLPPATTANGTAVVTTDANGNTTVTNSAYDFLTSGNGGGGGGSTPAGQTSTTTALLFLAVAVGVLFLVK